MPLFKLFCPKCGQSNADDATFCQKCGADLKMSATSGSPGMGSGIPGSTPPPAYSGANPMPSSFNIVATFKHAIDLVKSPASVMTAYRDSDTPINSLMIHYVAVLAVLTFVGTLIGDLITFRVFGYAGGYAVGHAILEFILSIVAVFIVGFIIWKLAPNFKTTTTQVRATRLAAYSYTPYFLASILLIIPYVGGILTFLAVLYGLYILYLGLPIMLGTPQEQALTYVIISVVAVIVVYLILGAIAVAILAAAFGLAFGFGYFM
jgi:hypothetical protein